MPLLQAFLRPSLATSLRWQSTCRRYANTSSASSSSTTTQKSKEKAPAGEGKKSGSEPVPPPPRSSCNPDTVLTGVNYLKGQPPVVALADDAYPEWLWSTLKPRVYEDDGPGGKKERVERRKANKQAIKDRNFMQTQ